MLSQETLEFLYNAQMLILASIYCQFLYARNCAKTLHVFPRES